MVSLTTIYGAGAAIGTVAAFVAAYVGHKVYPIQTGGSIESVIETVKNTAKEVASTVTDTITKTPEQPLNTDVSPLEPPVEETSLPSVEVPPQAPSLEQPSTA